MFEMLRQCAAIHLRSGDVSISIGRLSGAEASLKLRTPKKTKVCSTYYTLRGCRTSSQVVRIEHYPKKRDREDNWMFYMC